MTRISKLLIVSLSSCCLMMAASAAFACEDDQRLFSIGTFLNDVSEGKAEPLRLTAKTFLELTPAARELIGDNVRVLSAQCQPIEILRGQPPAKIELPFPVIYNAFHDAVLRGDVTTQSLMLRSFQAAPVDALEFLTLLSQIKVTPAVTTQMANAAGIRLNKTYHTRATNINYSRPCETGESHYITFADIFIRFGGRVTGRNGVAWFAVTNIGNVASVDYNVTASITRSGGCVSGTEALASRITSAGAVAISIDSNYWRDSEYEARELLAAYEAWVADGAPESLPRSLFD